MTSLVEMHRSLGDHVLRLGKALTPDHPKAPSLTSHDTVVFHATSANSTSASVPVPGFSDLAMHTSSEPSHPSEDSTNHARLQHTTAYQQAMRTIAAFEHELAAFCVALQQQLDLVSPGWSCAVSWGYDSLESGFSFAFARTQAQHLFSQLWAINPKDTGAWARQSTQLAILESLSAPSSLSWRVFAKNRSSTWTPSCPHHAHDAHDAFRRCTALEWPDLLKAYAPESVWVAQDHPYAASLL